jgi:hypothetical protein
VKRPRCNAHSDEDDRAQAVKHLDGFHSASP